MDLLDHDFNNWYSQYWKSSAEEVTKSLLSGKSIEEYLDEVFAMLNEIIDQGRMPNIAASVFGFWCSKVEADILRIVKGKQQAEFGQNLERPFSNVTERLPSEIFRNMSTFAPFSTTVTAATTSSLFLRCYTCHLLYYRVYLFEIVE